MKVLYVIAASQDFKSANHRKLWERLSQLENADVVVANIPADYVVTTFKRKFDRIKEAKGTPVIINTSLKIVRPMLMMRPEICPVFLRKTLAGQFWKSIETAFSVETYDEIRLIIYNAYWAGILENSIPDLKMAYYLFDEVRNNGNDNSINMKRYREDMEACSKSKFIFAMSRDIVDARKEFKEKIYLVGNGAELPEFTKNRKINNSVAFIGNFRSWIDMDLLEKIIEKNSNYFFYFIGPIENNMKAYFEKLQKRYINVFYGGCKDKKEIISIYSMFESVIIPYKQMPFIHATRPIKIVEAVMAGVPVVTVPVSGYEESEFIHFATNVDEFSKGIKICSEKGIDRNSLEYQNFVEDNTWKAKVKVINRIFDGGNV